MFQDTKLADKENLIEVSKPLFYGFSLLAAASMFISTSFTGTLLGVAVMAAITFVTAGLSDILEEDWKRFMEIIAILTLLGAVLSASYIAAMLSVV